MDDSVEDEDRIEKNNMVDGTYWDIRVNLTKLELDIQKEILVLNGGRG